MINKAAHAQIELLRHDFCIMADHAGTMAARLAAFHATIQEADSWEPGLLEELLGNGKDQTTIGLMRRAEGAARAYADVVAGLRRKLSSLQGACMRVEEEAGDGE